MCLQQAFCERQLGKTQDTSQQSVYRLLSSSCHPNTASTTCHHLPAPGLMRLARSAIVRCLAYNATGCLLPPPASCQQLCLRQCWSESSHFRKGGHTSTFTTSQLLRWASDSSPSAKRCVPVAQLVSSRWFRFSLSLLPNVVVTCTMTCHHFLPV